MLARFEKNSQNRAQQISATTCCRQLHADAARINDKLGKALDLRLDGGARLNREVRKHVVDDHDDQRNGDQR